MDIDVSPLKQVAPVVPVKTPAKTGMNVHIHCILHNLTLTCTCEFLCSN